MYSENGLLIDLGEVSKAIQRADVFTIGFPHFADRLLVDTREQDGEGPLVRLVGPVSSVQERFFELGRLRPRFAAPQRFMFFIWPHSVRFLEQSGVFDQIQRRCAPRDEGAVATMCAEAIGALRRLEREALVEAVRGDSFKTIWQAEPAG